MRAGRIDRVMVRRISPAGGTGAGVSGPDEVVVEEPLEIRLGGTLVTTTMRTPGNDFELAVGFCAGEGLLDGAEVRGVRYCATGSAVETEFNVVTVDAAGGSREPVARLTTTTSSCGLCGSEAIDRLSSRLRPLDGAPRPIPAAAVRAVGAGAPAHQPLFARTGSVHAAVAFSLADGEVVVAREDIGRHNAVDKVVGRLLLDGELPAAELGLFLSGRVSLEMVQKAWAAGFPAVVAVGGPSSLAVATARAANITLVAFARGDAMTVYAGEVA
ncbi:MAG TPA: formate dehydrogenase accessory sulfurtransferase FdhD [Acidimicrobiales bacterium]|nr:formate dehydrogenase accessory sulfurtransferase FdhD [Acidimicrobiales bacterium]